MSDRTGQQIGNYRLIRLLGQGGFAKVYLGEHIFLKTPAAIKLLQTQLASQEDTDNFLREAQTIARLVHPNIVRVMDFGMDEHTPYLVMDYAPNGTLRQRHPKGTRLELPIILKYVKQIADALQHAHEEKIIHRDIKPENMLLGRRDEILISDFGIAVVAQGTQEQKTQESIGTLTYMAPEQLQGHPRPASDQYALGVIVYEWLCGSPPFRGQYFEVFSQKMLMDPPPLTAHMQTVPDGANEVLRVALAKDPAQRFGSVQAFAYALDQVTTQSSYTHYNESTSQPFAPTVLHKADSSGQPFSYTPPNTPTSQTVRVEHSSQPGISQPPLTPIAPVAQTSRVDYHHPPQPGGQSRSSNTSKFTLFGTLALLLVLLGAGFLAFGKTLFPPTASTPTPTVVQATPTSAPTATATQVPTPTSTPDAFTTITGGTPAFSDSLSGANVNIWDEDGQCSFSSGMYHVHSVGTQNYGYCVSQQNSYSNFIYQIKITLVKGDCSGIVFRRNGATFYYACIGQNGSYSIYLTKKPGDPDQQLAGGSTSFINKAPGQSNLLAIYASGTDLSLYINGHFVAKGRDSTLQSGLIGVIAAPHGSPSEAAYSNAQVWTA